MENDIFERLDVVKEYGNDKQVEHFEKYKKWKSKNVEESFNKTLDEIFGKDNWETIKKGRKSMYKLGAKLNKRAERADNRKFNRGNGRKTQYEYELNSLVLDYILKKQNEGNLESMSLNKWLIALRLIDRRLTSSYYSQELRKNYLVELMDEFNDEDNGVLEFTSKDISMLKHFVENELNTLKSNLDSTLKRLEKCRIIMHKEEWKGCTNDGVHRVLTSIEFNNIGKMKREVALKHDILLKDLWKENEETEVYWEEYNKRLNKEFRLKYIYKAHGAVVQVSDREIEGYLQKLSEKDELLFCYGLSEDNIAFMLEDFKKFYGKGAIKRAEGRQKNKDNKNDYEWIKQKKVLEEYVPMWEKLLKFFELTSN